jgi:cytochrome P450
MGATGVTIDLLSPESFSRGQPHEQFRWLREHDPVHWHTEPSGRGFWAVTRYEDVKAVGRDATTYSSEPTIMIPDGGGLDMGDHKMMLTMDPPRHSEYRRTIVTSFIPRAARAMQPRILDLARKIVDDVGALHGFDLVEDVAGLMPSYVIADMLGIPQQDGVALYQLTETIHAVPSAVAPGAQAAAVQQMFAYAHDLWVDKRRQPADDLATRLIQATVDDHPLDEIDFQLFFLLLVDAGGDTTRNLVAGGMDALFDHPDQLARLRADVGGLLPTAVEELLRWVSPVVYMRRTAQQDTQLGDQAIRAGEKVVMYYGAANRDETHFADAGRLDVGRTPNDHVAFGGGGPHFCLGAHIARVEIEALLSELITRLPGLHRTGPTEWLPSNFISGPKHLPVTAGAS